MTNFTIDYDKKLPGWLHRDYIDLTKPVLDQLKIKVESIYNTKISFKAGKPDNSVDANIIYLQLKHTGPFSPDEFRLHFGGPPNLGTIV